MRNIIFAVLLATTACSTTSQKNDMNMVNDTTTSHGGSGAVADTGKTNNSDTFVPPTSDVK